MTTTERVLNLTFHGVGDPPRPLDQGEAAVWLAAGRFEQALDAVRGRDGVHVTFDDGNESDARIVLPALAARGMTASFFVLGGKIGQPTFLSAEALRELAAAGMRIGSHGLDHRAWRGLSDADLGRELVDAKARIEDVVGRKVNEAACPFGSYDRRILARLRTAGFERVYTSDRWFAATGQWLQPRFTVHHDDTPASLVALAESRPGPLRSVAAALRLAAKRWR